MYEFEAFWRQLNLPYAAMHSMYSNNVLHQFTEMRLEMFFTKITPSQINMQNKNSSSLLVNLNPIAVKRRWHFYEHFRSKLGLKHD